MEKISMNPILTPGYNPAKSDVWNRVHLERAAAAQQAAVAVREPAAVVTQRAEPLVGADELNYARTYLSYFAHWPGSGATLDMVCLWIGHAHARDASGSLVWQASPRLLFQSAEPGSGKSHAMRLTARICPRPALFTEPSEAAVAHAVGKEKATLFLDEADILFSGRRKAAIRAVCNDGYSPMGEWARVRSGSVEKISTFGALGLAGLESLETGTDGRMTAFLTRCLRVRMVRGEDGYRPPRWDREASYVASKISERLSAWAGQELGRLEDDVPDVPDGVGNRQAELWEPLLAVADAAGGRWPDAARAACEELTATGGQADAQAETASELDRIMAGWGQR